MICRCPFKASPHYGKWLAVLENQAMGWWLPGGGVDFGESFEAGGLRECVEEANVQVTIKGVLNVDYFSRVNGDKAKMRMIYYCEPVSLEAANNPKDWVDRESQKAEWKTVAELEELKRKKMLRGAELLNWATYLESGGHIYPKSMFGDEGEDCNPASSASFTL